MTYTARCRQAASSDMSTLTPLARLAADRWRINNAEYCSVLRRVNILYAISACCHQIGHWSVSTGQSMRPLLFQSPLTRVCFYLQVLRCSTPNCSCDCFVPGKPLMRVCAHCNHGWIAHGKLVHIALLPLQLTGSVRHWQSRYLHQDNSMFVSVIKSTE